MAQAEADHFGVRGSKEFIQAAQGLVGKDHSRWCIVAVDVEHFKIYNEWYGRDQGDRLLTRIGEVLKRLEKRSHAVCGYFGMDDFGVCMRYDERAIRRLYDNIRSVVVSNSTVIGFRPIFGINVFEGTETITMAMYDHAVVALEQKKREGRDEIGYFDAESFGKEAEEFRVLTEFQEALLRGEIGFQLQPIYRISNGRIVAFEALARWEKQDGSIVSPGSFIPVLEKNGFVTDLDKMVWEKVCGWLQDIYERNIEPVPVSLNVSRRDIYVMDVPAYLYALTEQYNLSPQLLKVEITESAYAEDFDKVRQVAEDLHEKGFPVMMDDFGTGYSSLNMLSDVNVDVIKLDMAFLKRKEKHRGVNVLESIINMCKTMGMPMVVEGVEQAEQLLFLKHMGCRYAQGHYFNRALEPKVAEILLQDPLKIDYKDLRAKTNEQFRVREFLDENLFTDTLLNSILGPVAIYRENGQSVDIIRFNEQFYESIGDPNMEMRRDAIQNYVMEEDRPVLWQLFEDAVKDIANGGTRTLRFYKSGGGVFWFQMQMFFLKEEEQGRIYYGKITDVTEDLKQSIRFLDILKQQTDFCLRMNVTRGLIQRISKEKSLADSEAPTASTTERVETQILPRIPDPEEKAAFRNFMDPTKILEDRLAGDYEDEITVTMQMENGGLRKVRYSLFCTKSLAAEDLYACVFGTLL